MKNPRIRRNVYGNWYGYLGTKKIAWFVNTPEESQEDQARRWLAEQRKQALLNERSETPEERELRLEKRKRKRRLAAWRKYIYRDEKPGDDDENIDAPPVPPEWADLAKHYEKRPME